MLTMPMAYTVRINIMFDILCTTLLYFSPYNTEFLVQALLLLLLLSQQLSLQFLCYLGVEAF